MSIHGGPRLVDAVRSLMSQNPPPAELVVVNSGGGEPEARLRTAGIEVPVIDHTDRLYPGAVRNAGIATTTARFVAFLAADCVAMPGWVKERLIAHSAGADGVGGAVLCAPPQTRVARAGHLFLYHERMPDIPPRGHRQLHSLSYDRRLFELHGLFREDMRSGEDTEFLFRIRDHTEIVFSPKVRFLHPSPVSLGGMVRDQFARGWRRSLAESHLNRPPHWRIAVSAARNISRSVRAARLIADRRERRRMLAATPLLFPAAFSYIAGVMVHRWSVRGQRR
jgi:glycosyltransferase involved in cell wall biosynthesis